MHIYIPIPGFVQTAFNTTRGYLSTALNHTTQAVTPYVHPVYQMTTDKAQWIWQYIKPILSKEAELIQTKPGIALICFGGAASHITLSRTTDNRALSLTSLAIGILELGTGAYLLCNLKTPS